MTYPYDDELWWVKITDYREKSGAMGPGDARCVTIRGGQEDGCGWIADMGLSNDLKAIQRAIRITELHNTDLITRGVVKRWPVLRYGLEDEA
jgi:hypothetical protein